MKGITITLIERTQTGVDSLNRPTYTETETPVDNVLVYPGAMNDVISETDLDGKSEIYTLGIPKSDAHDWLNCRVRFWGKTYKQFGGIARGIDDLIPGPWNQKVTVERYE